MKGELVQIVCEHRVTCRYWYELDADTWHAIITHTELRRGEQYGGAVIEEITSKPGESHDNFKLVATRKARQGIALFWL